MSNEIKVPDIGGASDVEVIEVHVKAGDKVEQEDSLITLESEKAAMDVPAPSAGTVKEVKVKVGDKISEGSVILIIDAASDEKKPAEEESTEEKATEEKEVAPTAKTSKENAQAKPAATESTGDVEIKVPDIGGATDVEVIEIEIKVGDKIKVDDPIATLESEKSAMDVPSTVAGVVKAVKIKVGDKVSEGSLLAVVEGAAPAKAAAPDNTDREEAAATTSPKKQAAPSGNVYAGPAVRRLAHELDINLTQVRGTGEKGRITKDDLKASIGSGQGGGGALPAAPVVDFSKFGETEIQALTRINKLTAKNMQRNWLLVPHVTQFEDSDITDMEAFRKATKAQAEKEGFKLTPLVFIMKAAVAALKAYPRVNSSLEAGGENLVMKKYFHIGVAVDTPNGLVVPVIRDVDKKSLFDLAKELGEVSKKARDGKLSPAEMQGGCFTISSLGGIGGTAFTPIVNVPEVAILGVSKSKIQPVFDGKDFQPRLILPLSLSYDHRVIDGALGARFVVFLGQCLSDIRKLLL